MTYNVWYETENGKVQFIDKVFTNREDAIKYLTGQLEWLDLTEEKMWIVAEHK